MALLAATVMPGDKETVVAKETPHTMKVAAKEMKHLLGDVVSCDVLVVGGGAAGVAAALQSGRAGASTVLVERGSQVGGNMTTGGVNFPGLFHAEGRQIIDGCAYEILTPAGDCPH